MEELAERRVGQRDVALGEDLLRGPTDCVTSRRGERDEGVARFGRLGDRTGRPKIGRDHRDVGPLSVFGLEERDECLRSADLLDPSDDEVAGEGEQRERRQVELERPDLDLIGEVDVPFEVRIGGAEGRLADGERPLTAVRIAGEQSQDRLAHDVSPLAEQLAIVVGCTDAGNERAGLGRFRSGDALTS